MPMADDRNKSTYGYGGQSQRHGHHHDGQDTPIVGDPGTGMANGKAPRAMETHSNGGGTFFGPELPENLRRAELKRQEGMTRARELKEEGNREFKAGNLERAVEIYTEGLTYMETLGALYTNRAQAYNKLGRFEEAIADCDAILRLEPRNSKARVHRGKALLGLHRYDDAISSFREILSYDPRQTSLVEKYVAEVDQAKESAANVIEVDKNAMNVSEVLQRLWKPKQGLLYYAGGMRVLAQVIQDDNARNSFRKENGFDILKNNSITWAVGKSIEGEKKENIEVTLALMALLSQVTFDNAENCRMVLESESFAPTCLALIGCSHPDISHQSVVLLLMLTQSDQARALVIQKFDGPKLLFVLLAFIMTSDKVVQEATKILNFLALQNGFKNQFKTNVEKEVIPAFQKILKSRRLRGKDEVFSSCLSVMGNMALDPTIRNKLAHSKEFWNDVMSVLSSLVKNLSQPAKVEMAFVMLGVLMNISTEKSEAYKDHCGALCSHLCKLVKCDEMDIKGRATDLLVRSLPYSPGGLQGACDAGIPLVMLQSLQTPDLEVETVVAFSRCLAFLTYNAQDAKKQVAEADRVLQALRDLLSSSSDVVLSNIILCIRNCLDVPGVCQDLVKTDIVVTLLEKTSSATDSIKQNCFLALTKLAAEDKRHSEALEMLGGVEVLKSCAKYVAKKPEII